MKAFTIIFFATIVIWLLQSFDLHFEMVEDSAQSILASIGKFVAPIFTPLGFGNWQAVTALITGLTAKEAVVQHVRRSDGRGRLQLAHSYFSGHVYALAGGVVPYIHAAVYAPVWQQWRRLSASSAAIKTPCL